MPERIQRRRTKGWKMPENTVYVGRPSRYGNPFVVGGYYKKGDYDSAYKGPFKLMYTRCLDSEADETYTQLQTPEQALDWYRWYLSQGWKYIESLRGKNLACWCPVGSPCHGDILLEFANSEPG